MLVQPGTHLRRANYRSCGGGEGKKGKIVAGLSLAQDPLRVESETKLRRRVFQLISTHRDEFARLVRGEQKFENVRDA